MHYLQIAYYSGVTSFRNSPISCWRVYANSPRSVAGFGGALRDAALAHASAAHSLPGANCLPPNFPYASPPTGVQGQVVGEIAELLGRVST